MKLKLPKAKIKFDVGVALWTVFFICIVIEGLVLFNNLYLNSSSDVSLSAIPTHTSKIDFNMADFQKVYGRIQEKVDYQIPSQSYTGTAAGRDNPFADYK